MSWDYDRTASLTAKGPLCTVCGQQQMKAFAFVELRSLHASGRFSESELLAALEGYCLGHFGEWHPDLIIQEECES